MNSYPDSQLGSIRSKFHLQLLHKYRHLVENITTEASDADCVILADFWKATGSHPTILPDKEVNNSPVRHGNTRIGQGQKSATSQQLTPMVSTLYTLRVFAIESKALYKVSRRWKT